MKAWSVSFWNGSAIAEMTARAGTQPLTPGTWQHVAVQRSGSALELFVDGIPGGTFQAAQPLPAMANIVVGGGWIGAIDDVRLYNRAFPAASMPQAAYSWTQVKAQLVNQNLEGFYPFKGNADNDLGHGGDGTVFNATLTADRFGTPAAAYQFNGSDAYIAILDNPFISTSADFAICFWEQSSSATPMAAVSVTPGGPALDVVFNAGAGIAIMLAGAAVPSLSYGSVGSLTDGQWHFVILQRVGSTLQLYIDGTLQAQAQSDAVIFGGSSVAQFGKGSGVSAAPRSDIVLEWRA